MRAATHDTAAAIVSTAPVPRSTRRARAPLSGATYIAASSGFLVVFGWLASHFGYPDVLDAPATDVLPRLLALGAAGRTVWAVYALLPLLLLPAVVGAAAALRAQHDTPRTSAALTLAVVLQAVSSFAMTIGLARWSTLQWTFATAWETATPSVRTSIALTSDAMNAFLGNALGEFVGESTLYGAFAALAYVVYVRRAWWLTALGALTAVAGWVGMFRNMTPSVEAVAALSNGLLPLFLIVFGAWLAWPVPRTTAESTAET
jgi:hypothetical protein